MQRLLSDLLSNANSKLSRQSVEATVLALLSLFAVSALRYGVESRTLFIAEMLGIAFCFTGALFASSKTPIISATVPLVPLVAAFIARFTGSPIAYEMTMLTMLGAAALGMAIGSARTRATSLIASGFLTLFAVAISDSQYAVLIAIAWMAGCVWHLVANHWERLDLCAVENVQRSHGVRPASVLAAVVLFGISGWIVRDRFSDSTQLTFGFMPTSGGSKWSDPAARSGVGTGDAAIAAKDHAESFGAVESDLFLESTESTLFDMFSDSIGEPKRKMKWERRQGLTAERVLEAHQKTAKSEKGGNSFSIDRMPAEKHLKLKDAVENAVVQWAGPTGIRLAMNRYDTFDGVEWSNSASHRNENLVRQANEDAAWFCDPSLVIRKTGDPQPKTVVNQLKVLRLDSTRLPTPMMTAGVHIKDVDRQDFFAIDDDGSYFMPGREKVPQMTVVNIESQTFLEDVLCEQV
ncbi:MAG: hypothetical protein ACF8CQ_17740 [Rhodopirellula sp. JB044]|uniref:hypothetical protein n=1 Tax=Rhodopirellula sp. JB044 TaxID=3342844 RepID=UPI00370C41D8